MGEGTGGLPGAEILVNGSPLAADAMSHVSRVMVRTRVDGSDTFQIEMDAGPEHWQDEDFFKLGSEITIKMGQTDDVQVVHEGDITAWFVEFLHRKGTRFLLRGHDRSHRLHRAVKYRSFAAESDGDVVREMASDHGLEADVEDPPFNGETRVQFNQTDHAFIKDRARRLGWVYRVKGNKLTFRPPAFEDSNKAYSMAKEILTYDFGLELNPVPTSVTVRGWDPWKKEAVEHVAKPGEEWWKPVAKKAGSKLSEDAFGENDVHISELALPTVDEAKEIAQGLFQRLSERSLGGAIVVRGDPELDVGTTLYLEGVGKALQGNFLIHNLSHNWTRKGLFTRLEVFRNALEV